MSIGTLFMCVLSFVRIGENCRRRSSDFKKTLTTDRQTYRQTSVTDTISSAGCKSAAQRRKP